MMRRLLVPILLAAVAGACGSSASGDNDADSAKFQLKLVRQDEFLLDDPDTPVQYLEQLTLLGDGGFAAVDIVAGKVRRFDGAGRLLAYIGPPEAAIDDWQPQTAGVGASPDTLWVSDKRGRMWKFEELGKGPVSQPFTHPHLINFALNSRDDIVARRPLESGELHLYRNGTFIKHFLESDRFNQSLTAKSTPFVAIDDQETIYAIRFLDPTVFVFTPQGEEIRRWRLPRDRDFREFPFGMNPYSSTRDRSVILAWHRTFTTFPRIEWVAGDRVAVLSANDPPRRPNVLSLYTSRGELIASAEVQGYLVAARGRNLYFANQFLFYDGPCHITRFTIDE